MALLGVLHRTRAAAVAVAATFAAIAVITAMQLLPLPTCDAARAQPFRVHGSPYPAPSKGAIATCGGPLYAYDSSSLSASQIVTMQTLQGGLARQCPRLFRVGTDVGMAPVWLADLEQRWGVTVEASPSDFGGLLKLFKGDVAGYVTYSAASSDTVNVAVSYAAALSTSPAGVVVAVELGDVAALTTALGSGASHLVAAENRTYADVLKDHPISTDFNTRIFDLQDPSKSGCLVDWATFAGALHYWDSTPNLSDPTSKAVFAAAQAPAAMFGWGTSEGNSVDSMSGVGMYIHASDFAHNLATLACFDAADLQQKRSDVAVEAAAARRGGAGAPAAAVARKHTVSFLMTDGDNVQWLLNDFADPGGKWFGSTDRGKVPLGWTMSPAMAELAPSVLSSFYRNMSTMDAFIAAPSGVGYAIPGKFPHTQSEQSGDGRDGTNGSDPSLQAFTDLTSSFLGKADMSVVNYIADSNCAPECTDPMLAHDNIDSVLLYYGGGYVGGNGLIQWSAQGKPVIAGRYALWGSPGSGFDDPVSLTRKLRALPKDPRDPQAYSLIPVHVWTHNVSDVVAAAGLLGGDFFDVVTPEELVSRVSANVYHDCASAPKATGPYAASCSGGADSCGALTNAVCKGEGGSSVTNPFFDHTVCQGNAVNNCFGWLQCVGEPCACPAAPTGSYAQSCTGCRVECGRLVGCDCGGTAVPTFDYSVCSELSVAVCYGALLCQGQPCQ